jgi:hypothetical protein
MGEAKRRQLRYAELQAILEAGDQSEIRIVVDEITKWLTDNGQLIEAGFISLRAMAIPQDAPPEQIACMRDSFFAGAQHLFGSIMTMLDPGVDPTTADISRLDSISKELDRFIEAWTLAHTAAEGSS